MFTDSIAFDPSQAEALLKQVPAECGVFALYGTASSAGAASSEGTVNGTAMASGVGSDSRVRKPDQPYLTRTANLRRRLTRLLSPPESQSKRLNLRNKVARIEYSVTGSEFESTLLLYQAHKQVFGPEDARKRLRLSTPFFIRFAAENAYPRAYVTNRLSKRALPCYYGPFPSRTGAERYLDESLNLFKLRRCHEELNPDPAFPGCVYSEMKMCLAPCFKGCTAERYAEEAVAVERYLATRGESLLADLAAARERASEAMEFEQAAALHAQMLKAKAAASLADEIVRPIPKLNALILQPAPGARGATPAVALFMVRSGFIAGPVLFSTVGMRHPNEHSGSTSLFAHPVALAPVPLDADGNVAPVESLEDRLARALEGLLSSPAPGSDAASLADHLAILRRWYFRPEKQRAGEIFFAEATAAELVAKAFPLKRILRGVSRVFSGVREATAAERDLATYNLHNPH